MDDRDCTQRQNCHIDFSAGGGIEEGKKVSNLHSTLNGKCRRDPFVSAYRCQCLLIGVRSAYRCQSYTIHRIKSASYVKLADLPR